MANLLMPLQIERQYGASLDANYSFDTLEELKNYATTSALSYSGQILYCKENDTLYKVNNDKTDVGSLGGGGEEVDLTEYIKEADADEKYVLDEDIEVIDSATIESMLNLSDEELTNLSTMFQDAEVRIDRGWSSSKIYSELNTTLDIAKAYTLSELAKSIGASYKVVTSVDQMTDGKVLYLLKDADSGMYNIYVYDADTSTAELIGSFEINLDDYLKISDAEAQYVKQTDLVANYATKQEVVDGYATKTELQDAIDDVEVEISETENNQIQTLDDGLFVGSETITISKADYDALSVEEKSNGKTYFVPDDETTEDGTDLTQFAKVSDLEDGTITVGNSKKLNGLTKDELFADTNSKIEEINNNLSDIGNVYNTEINITNPMGEWAIGARLELSNGTYIIFRRGYSLTESIIIGKGYSIGDYVSSIAKEQSATYIEVQKIDTPTTICNFIFANSDIYNDISAVRIG